MSAMRVSACIDCTMTVLGERPRCPACQAAYARSIEELAIPAVVETPKAASITRVWLMGLVVMEAIASVILIVILVFGGC